MKKIYFILIPLIILIGIAGSSLLPQVNRQRMTDENEILTSRNKKNKTSQEESGKINTKLNCKTCHASEYPNKNDPGLRNCPRNSMMSEFPKSKEGPDVVAIDEMSDNYKGVIFSHKIHSQMSEMSTGCTGCHHYNTSGPVLSCKECHEKSRTREDVSVPDLKAAFHRQCMTCHKQWSHDNGCSTTCHTRNGSEYQSVSLTDISKKTHPVLSEPNKMIWETNYGAGKIVTFFHNEHIKIFKIECKSCHSQDNCIKCHESKVQRDFSQPIKTQKSFEEHHQPCVKCHEGNTCQKCHNEKEMTSFNHGKSTGWALNSYHNRLACSKCHGNSMPYKKLDNNCVSCHKNFVDGKLDHKVIGLALSENHATLECNSCHKNGNFVQAPECSMCHDDKSFPAYLPGKRVKNKTSNSDYTVKQ